MAAHMARKPLNEMTVAEIEREKRELADWLLDFTGDGLCGYSLDALRNAYDALVNSEEFAEEELARAKPAPSEAELAAMMRDPRYWRDRNPELVAQVRDGFRRLNPNA